MRGKCEAYPPSYPISSTFFSLFTPSSLSFSSSSLARSLLDVFYVVGGVEAHHAVFQAPSAPALVVLVSYLGELLTFRTKKENREEWTDDYVERWW